MAVLPGRMLARDAEVRVCPCCANPPGAGAEPGRAPPEWLPTKDHY